MLNALVRITGAERGHCGHRRHYKLATRRGGLPLDKADHVCDEADHVWGRMRHREIQASSEAEKKKKQYMKGGEAELHSSPHHRR
ncbi:hypothetical protein NDU88_002449 [Pleurodeles waltl]|uniref:Uncharacterized protein n=1 Tax=Pleurodeles waltl TaxID=8319 RepID=A0AAV7PA06_PLEWA|nr:hypothetical protein NDU88_002449 [Pleurodeles waltl]